MPSRTPWLAVFFAALFAALFALVFASPAQAEDEPGSRDHPLVGRYQGASIVFYKQSDFDEVALLKAPHDYAELLDRNATKDRSGPEWLQTEGRITRIRYEVPPGRSSLEVLRNHEAALKAKGFAPVFACADAACLTGKLTDPYLVGEQIDPDNGVSTLYFDHARYTLMKADRPEGTVYVALLVGEYRQTVTDFVLVVETKGMEGDRIVFLDADEIGRSLSESGKVDIYGIQFDYDKDVLKPESAPTLAEIAKVLQTRPELRLDVVGHTDGRGTAEYNLDLSRRRAASVVTALTGQYGIAAGRLNPSGLGASAPVASNDTDEGRAQNRRVELIAK